ncbi:hypothetical protein LCGC14_1567380 [marine sediment metagenome]|uniref:Uncharacterized protein n=1 Tax=marine sediment metagenome TaxID=412755 RepID=A0A0F9J6X2_9ZZZZ
MQTGTHPVRSGGEVVGQASFTIYDSIEEAIENLGPAETTAKINAQLRTDALNAVRSEHTGKPTKIRIKEMAIEELTKEDHDRIAGDTSVLKEVIAAREAAIRNRLGIDE